SWGKGAKTNKKEEEEKKRQEALQKKAEREALLAAEEAELLKKKPAAPAKGGKSSSTSKPSNTPSSIDAFISDRPAAPAGGPDAYAATNIDDALQLLDLTAKGVATPQAAASAGIERHPEKRMKSAWAAFEEREMPILKEENPHLRLSQLKQLLQKKWKKSPDNPLNWEANVSYDATRTDIKETVKSQREAALESMRVN
ncbi:hypothetical protein HDU76_011006, partial [Blyttiomyces sp. JEL0837]